MVDAILPLYVEDAIVMKRKKQVIGPVSLTIDGGGMSVIMGPNGAGKTTLLKLMHGIEHAHKGAVRWNCDTLHARSRQAFVFQNPIMLRRSVLENLVYPQRLQQKGRKEAIEVAENWLQRLGLKEVANLGAQMLSGGEKQKLAIGRALSCEPEVLFLDEPTSNLDGTSTREIETILKEVTQSGTKIVMTTHDLGQARRLADEVIFLYRGKVHERDAASAFFDASKTKEATAFLNGEIVE